MRSTQNSTRKKENLNVSLNVCLCVSACTDVGDCVPGTDGTSQPLICRIVCVGLCVCVHVA